MKDAKCEQETETALLILEERGSKLTCNAGGVDGSNASNDSRAYVSLFGDRTVEHGRGLLLLAQTTGQRHGGALKCSTEIFIASDEQMIQTCGTLESSGLWGCRNTIKTIGFEGIALSEVFVWSRCLNSEERVRKGSRSNLSSGHSYDHSDDCSDERSENHIDNH